MNNLQRILKNRSIRMFAGGILFLVLTCFFLRGCDFGLGKPQTTTETETSVLVPGDEKPQVKEYIPKAAEVVYRDRTVMQSVDTAEILRQCLAVRYYSDTAANDSDLLVVADDSVSAAGIISRKWTIQNKRPVALLQQTTVTRERTKGVQVYAGVFGGYTVAQKRAQLGPEVFLNINEAATVGYGFDALNNGHVLHVAAKISWRKRK